MDRQPENAYPLDDNAPTKDALADRLRAIVTAVGPEQVWRPLYDHRGNKLSDGIADPLEGRREDLALAPLAGARVVDLGCNFGEYSFMARDLGAAHVTGVDIDPRVIEGARILARLHDRDGVDFACGDFTDPAFAATLGNFDIALLVNFLGKATCRKGAAHYLDAVARLAEDAMVLMVRPVYGVAKDIRCPEDELAACYGRAYVKDDCLMLEDFVRDRYAADWDMRRISPDYEDYTIKRMYVLRRRGA